MKSCAYCGQDNDDAAVCCAGCGTEAFEVVSPAPTALPPVTSPPGVLRLRDILTNPPLRFRALVVASIVPYLIWFFSPWVADRFVSQETADALAWRGYGALLPLPLGVGWLFMLLYSALAVGLWGFSKSARLVFTLFSAYSLLDVLLAGIQVQTPFGAFLLLITNMADGALLVSAYTSPLKERFG